MSSLLMKSDVIINVKLVNKLKRLRLAKIGRKTASFCFPSDIRIAVHVFCYAILYQTIIKIYPISPLRPD